MGYLQSTTSYVDFEWPVSGWYRRVAGLAHTHTHTRVHTYNTHTGSSFGLYLSPEVQESAAYIYTHTHIQYTYLHVYIKRSTSLSLSFHPFYLSIFHRLSFKHLFPRPVSEAGLHGRHSRLGRDPSTIDSETRYRNLGAQHRASPPAKPRENPRLIAISPLRALPFRVDLVAGYGRRGGVADDFRFREPSV